MTYTIELPDGTLVGAGQGEPALGSLSLTRGAFPGTELDPGGVCAGELTAEIWGSVSVAAGDVLRLYRDGVLLGTFTAEKPTAPGPNRLRLTAYDAVAKLDKDLTQWLESLTDWPYTLEAFADMVCAACGLTLTGSLVNSSFPVARFRARGITGRQLMQWVCQAGCRFCTAGPGGGLTLSWVTDPGITLSPSGEHFYFDGMICSSYAVAAVDAVQLALTDSDVGVVSGEGSNVLSIRGNYLLCGATPLEAQSIARELGISYTPCTLETVTALSPGQRFTLDTGEEQLTAIAMTVEEGGGRFRVTCTGSASRDTSSALCRGTYQALQGRVLELSLDLQGVRSRMSQQDGQLESLSLLSQDVDAITGRVEVLESDTESRFSQLELRSDGVELSVGQLSASLDGKADAQELTELSKHFLFDSNGLTISDTATGMSVVVSQEAVAFQGGTSVTPTQLTTTNLQVGSNLKLGRFTLFPRSSGNLSIRYTG